MLSLLYILMIFKYTITETYTIKEVGEIREILKRLHETKNMVEILWKYLYIKIFSKNVKSPKLLFFEL